MSPFRLVILGLLFYILYRVLTGGRRPNRRCEQGQAAREEHLPAVHDVLVQDPVCQIYVPKGQAIMLQGKETHLYFCSERCRDTFLAQHQGSADSE